MHCTALSFKMSAETPPPSEITNLSDTETDRTKNMDTPDYQTPLPTRPATPVPVGSVIDTATTTSISKIKRPELKRNMSSFSKAIYSVEGSADISLPQDLSKLKLDGAVKAEMREDLKLVEEVKHETIPESANPETLPARTIEVASRYSLWECGFGTAIGDIEPTVVPNNKADFLKAIKGEIQTVSFIQNGLSKYVDAINSGEHHVFSEAFVRKQNTASQLTLGQLFQINEHLKEVVAQLGNVDDEDNSEVEDELRELFAHAKPWISRTRAVLVSAHVFYKVNYALAADARKTARPID